MNQTQIAMLQMSLAVGVVEVRFTKANGTTRIMQATKSINLIPVALLGSVVEHRNATSENITVYDTEVKEWRCVRFDRIVKFTVNV